MKGRHYFGHYAWCNLGYSQFSCSVISNTLRPHELQDASFSVHHQLLEYTQIHVHWVDNAIQPSHPQSSLSPTFNLSQHWGLFKWASSLHQVAKALEFQLQYQSFQWILRTDFFMIDCFDLLAVQGTLKSLLQYHNSKASILQCSAFFMVQLSHPYNYGWKT